SVDILQIPLVELRGLAQTEVEVAASKFLARLGLPSVSQSGKGFIITGHQPELFHPGVWVKNFAAHKIGLHHHSRSLNLIVDSDQVKSTSLLLPPMGGVRQTVAFDTGPAQAPYETRIVNDERIFRHFPDAMTELTRNLPWKPILEEFWLEVMAS